MEPNSAEKPLNVSSEFHLPDIYPEDDNGEAMPLMPVEMVYPKPSYSISLMTKEEDSREVSTSTANDTESDEPQHADGQSDISDTFSVASSIRSFKKYDYKKLATMVAKLKQENFALTEALDHARASDIAMLKTKLRGANADMMRLKQNNIELKERIQVLEDKLFKVLSDQVENKEEDDDNAAVTGVASISDVIRQKMKQKQQSKSSSTIVDSHQQGTRSKQGEDPLSATSPEVIDNIVIHPLGGNNRLTNSVKASYVALQQRCKHLETLRLSYEKTIQMLQDDIFSRKNAVQVKEEKTGKSVNFSIGDTNPTQSRLPPITEEAAKVPPMRLAASTQVVLQQAIEEARASDQKTIQELAKEVRRLTALLPRQLIEKDEEEITPGDNQAQEKITEDTVVSPYEEPTSVEDSDLKKEIEQNEQVTESNVVPTSDKGGGFCYKLMKTLLFAVAALLLLFVVILKLSPVLSS